MCLEWKSCLEILRRRTVAGGQGSWNSWNLRANNRCNRITELRKHPSQHWVWSPAYLEQQWTGLKLGMATSIWCCSFCAPLKNKLCFASGQHPKQVSSSLPALFPTNKRKKVENTPALGYSENQLTKPRPISHDFPWFPTGQFCSSRAFQSISIGGRSRRETRHVVDQNEATKMLELYSVYVYIYIYIFKCLQVWLKFNNSPTWIQVVLGYSYSC